MGSQRRAGATARPPLVFLPAGNVTGWEKYPLSTLRIARTLALGHSRSSSRPVLPVCHAQGEINASRYQPRRRRPLAQPRQHAPAGGARCSKSAERRWCTVRRRGMRPQPAPQPTTASGPCAPWTLVARRALRRQVDVHPNSSHGAPSPRVNDTLRYGLPTAPHALTADANSTSNTGAGFSPLKKTKEYAAKIKDKVWDKHVREGAEIKIESERLACKRANAREKRYEEDRQNPQEDGAAVVRDVMGVEVGEAVQLKKNLTSAGKIYGYMTTTPPDCKELLDQENKAPPIDFFKK